MGIAVLKRPWTSRIKPPLVAQFDYSDPQLQDILLWYQLNETGGNPVDEINNTVGVINNTLPWGIGQFGPQLEFSGGTGHLDLGSPAYLDNAEPFSITCRIFIDSAGADEHRVILNKQDAAFAAGVWFFTINVNNVLAFVKDMSGGDLDVKSSTQPPTDVWTDLAMTWDGSTSAANVHMYIDGVEVSYDVGNSDGGNNNRSDAARPMHLGARGDGSRPLNGPMSNLRFYGRVLSQPEIQDIIDFPNRPVITRRYQSFAEVVAAPDAFTRMLLLGVGR